MAGSPAKRARMLAEREEELLELGLLGVYITCPAPVNRGNCAHCNEGRKDADGFLSLDLMDYVCGRDDCGVEECARPVIKGRLRCVAHRYQDASCNQIVTSGEVMAEMRQYLTNTLAPMAVGAVQDVLEDERASHGDRLKASAMVMDRTGLPAGQTLQVEATVKVLPPAEMMAQAIGGIRERLGKGGFTVPGMVTHEEPRALVAVPDPDQAS